MMKDLITMQRQITRQLELVNTVKAQSSNDLHLTNCGGKQKGAYGGRRGIPITLSLTDGIYM